MSKAIEIEQNNFLESTPLTLHVADVVYSEIPFRLSDEDMKKMMLNLNDLAMVRKENGLSSYFIVPFVNVNWFTGFDKCQGIKLHMEHGIVNAYLVQYGEKLRVHSSRELLNYLRVKYKTMGDPCAGTGRSAEGFEYVVLYDVDQSKVDILRSKFE